MASRSASLRVPGGLLRRLTMTPPSPLCRFAKKQSAACSSSHDSDVGTCAVTSAPLSNNIAINSRLLALELHAACRQVLCFGGLCALMSAPRSSRSLNISALVLWGDCDIKASDMRFGNKVTISLLDRALAHPRHVPLLRRITEGLNWGDSARSLGQGAQSPFRHCRRSQPKPERSYLSSERRY